MIKDKEYPATHSMSTSWFGIDKDGKVAIIDFNENGPVPPSLDEYCGEDLVESEFPNKLENEIYEIPLTDSQSEEVIQYLHFSSMDEDIDFTHIIKINPEFTSDFISTIYNFPKYDGFKRKTIRLSERLGLYICDFYGIPEATVKSLISRGIIQRNQYFSWDNDESFNEEKGRWDINAEQGSCLLPIYYYVQPYSTDQLIEKVNAPDNPLSETQISPTIRAKGLRFPFSFKNQKSFQILEYYHAISNDDDISAGKYEHIQVPLTDGTQGIVLTSFLPAISCKDCNLCNDNQTKYNPWSFITDKPTGIIISGQISSYDWKNIIGESFKHCVYSQMCRYIQSSKFSPSLGFDERIILAIEEKGKSWFSFISDNIIDAAETLKPYCILVESRLMPIIQDLFAVEGGWITLGSQKLRIFESDKLSENKDEIDRLMSQPYRGRIFERVQRLTDK